MRNLRGGMRLAVINTASSLFRKAKIAAEEFEKLSAETGEPPASTASVVVCGAECMRRPRSSCAAPSAVCCVLCAVCMRTSPMSPTPLHAYALGWQGVARWVARLGGRWTSQQSAALFSMLTRRIM